jgi:hypothetical protein
VSDLDDIVASGTATQLLRNYQRNPVPYTALLAGEEYGFNSNSFAAGLIQAAGMSRPPIPANVPKLGADGLRLILARLSGPEEVPREPRCSARWAVRRHERLGAFGGREDGQLKWRPVTVGHR